MRIRSNVRLSDDEQHGTLILRQRFSHRARRLRAAILAFAGFLICAPFILIVNVVGSGAGLYNMLAAHPVITLQLGLVALLGVFASVYGTYEFVRPSLRARSIRLGQTQVNVAENISGRARVWREPLHAYSGIRHRVTTTSEGAFHTLLIEHPQPERSLHIAYETNLGNQAIIEASERFGLPILNHSSIASRFRPRGKPASRFRGSFRPNRVAEATITP
jgi:hypothetical protein